MSDALEDNDKGLGLYDKYKVERLNPSSRGIDHSDCEYFVLDPAHDEIARKALWEYATLANEAGFYVLATDIGTWLRKLEEADLLAAHEMNTLEARIQEGS